METKRSLSSSLKDHCTRDSSTTTHHCDDHQHQRLNMTKVGSSLIGNDPSHPEDYQSGLSSPPRSYPCSFCKKEFRSPYAHRGHMKAHRKDRAKLPPLPPSPLPAKAEKADCRRSQYSCSFCKKEFRSPYARHGHMKAHRKDRTKLPLLPPSPLPAKAEKADCSGSHYPFLGLNLNDNPKPNSNNFEEYEVDLELRLG